MIKYKIENKLNRTGKRKMFYATINNKRISKYNFARKWEAERQVTDFIRSNKEEDILRWANK